MYTILSGAKKNLGDFLITDRSIRLLRHLKPNEELYRLPSWENLDPHLDKINKGKALIILGGPGYQKEFYPKVYKLTSDLNDIRIPIFLLGLGWKGIPGDKITERHYTFSPQSLIALKKISDSAPYLGCRDYISESVLKKSGITNTMMTGCPVWYNLDAIGKRFIPPGSIKNIVYTPAQLPIYRDQSVMAMRVLNELFPESNKFCSFHRGLRADDPFTPAIDESNNQFLATKAGEMGFEVKDVSSDLDRIKFYDDCDLHVGYRVHAHIYFLSDRKPSYLIHEDGRGIAASQALGIPGLDAFRRRTRFAGKIQTRLPGWLQMVAEPNVENRLRSALSDLMDSNFSSYSDLGETIDRQFHVMKSFIASIP